MEVRVDAAVRQEQDEDRHADEAAADADERAERADTDAEQQEQDDIHVGKDLLSKRLVNIDMIS